MLTEILLPTVDAAIEILGNSQVVRPGQNKHVFGYKHFTDSGVLRYPESWIEKAAVCNRDFGEWWNLVWIYDMNVFEQCRMLWLETKLKPSFPKTDDVKSMLQDHWAGEIPNPGYLLINLKPKFESNDWHSQNDQISAMGEGFRRAHIAEASQALLSLANVHNKALYLTTQHWSDSLVDDDQRVALVPKEGDCLTFEHHNERPEFGKLTTLVCREPLPV